MCMWRERLREGTNVYEEECCVHVERGKGGERGLRFAMICVVCVGKREIELERGLISAITGVVCICRERA